MKFTARLCAAVAFSLLGCSSVVATPFDVPVGWALITRGTDYSSYWGHLNTIRTEGRLVQLWVLTQLNQPETFRDRKFMSAKTLYVIDCTQSTMARVVYTAFTGDAGSGDIVRDLTLQPHELRFEPVAPDTIGSSIADYACKPATRVKRSSDDLAAALPPQSKSKPNDVRGQASDELALMDASYPNWYSHADSREFKVWLAAQPSSIQAMFKSANTAAKMLAILNMHRASQGLSTITLAKPQ